MFYPVIKRISLQPLWFSHILLLLLAISLFSNSISWIFLQLIKQEHQFSQMAVVILGAFLIYRINITNQCPTLRIGFNSRAMIGLICAGGMFVFNEYYIAINIISATFTILAFYALSGFFIAAHVWQRGLIFTLIFILLLPFGDYFDVFFGFPLRLASAQAASDLLTALGYAPQNLTTLIELDNQLSSVDLSCSGVHGLWSAMIFFVLLTWIEHKIINARWLVFLAIFLSLVTATNILRITLMVMLDTVLQQSQFAALVHNSLGLIGFSMACIMGWLLLSLLKTQTVTATEPRHSSPVIDKKYITLSWLLVSILMAFNFLYTPMVKEQVTISTSSPIFPQNWNEKARAMNVQEKDFFPRLGAYAQKFQFNRNGEISGSIVFVNTHYWKAHHDPKNCFQAQGYSLVNDQLLPLVNKASNKTAPLKSSVKLVHKLQLIRGGESYAAYYWFQSGTQHTADFTQRLFSSFLEQISGQFLTQISRQTGQKNKQTWTMISLLVKDGSVSFQDKEHQLLLELTQMTSSWIETMTTINTAIEHQENIL